MHGAKVRWNGCNFWQQMGKADGNTISLFYVKQRLIEYA